MPLPGMSTVRYGLFYDAIRCGASDGPLAPGELEHLQRSADTMGIAPDVVAELCQIVAEERALRDRRYELITAPVLGPRR